MLVRWILYRENLVAKPPSPITRSNYETYARP